MKAERQPTAPQKAYLRLKALLGAVGCSLQRFVELSRYAAEVAGCPGGHRDD